MAARKGNTLPNRQTLYRKIKAERFMADEKRQKILRRLSEKLEALNIKIEIFQYHIK